MPKQSSSTMTIQQYRQMQRYPDAKRQYQGKRSRNRGAVFEDILTASCELYKQLGLAEIDKTPEPMKILKRLENNRFMTCFLKRAQPDYKGTLQGGKSVVFEAKHTDSEQMEQSRVTAEQVTALDRHQSCGATCFVIVSFRMTDFYRIPWDDWKNMKALFQRKYVRLEELEKYRIKQGKGGILLFLD